MKRLLKFVPIAAIAVFASVGSAFADFPKEGTYDVTACLSGVATPIAFDKAHSAFTVETFGTTLSNPPGGFLDRGAVHCISIRTLFDGKKRGETVCEVMLPDGGKILSTFPVGADGVLHRQFDAGTGKYEGIVASGIVEYPAKFPTLKPGTFQFCNHHTGTYKLK